MKFTGFVSSVAGKILLVIFCLLLGMVLAIGGEALAGYIVLTREGMVGTIADAVQSRLGADSSLQITFDDETKAMSLLSWGSGLVQSIGDLGNSTIGGIEKLIGLNIISSTIEDMIGVDAEIIKDSSLSDLGSTVSENLTLNSAKDKFGINFPDMPIFNNDEFLSKPLSEAFSDFDSFKLEEVIDIGEDANVILKKMKTLKINELGTSATTDIINDTELGEVITIDEHSNAVLIELQHTKIGDLGGSTTTDTINNMELGQVIDIDEHSNAVLQELQHTKIGDLGKSSTDETIKGMFLCQLMTIDESSPQTLKSLKYATIESQYEVYPDDDPLYAGQKKDGKDGRALVYATKEVDGVEREQKGISEKMEEMELGDAIEIDEHSNAVLRELATTRITELGSASTDVTIKSMFLDQIMTIDESAPQTLKNLKYASIESQYEVYPTDDPTYPGEKKDGKGGRALEYKTKNYAGQDRPLKGISETIDELYIKDVVEITDSSSAILRKMRTPTEQEVLDGKASLYGTSDMLVKDLGGQALIDLINDTTIGEIITVNGTSEPILQALASTKIGDLNERMKTLKLSDIFEASTLDTGALSLLDPDTTVQNIPGAVTDVMFNATVATMVGKGIIDGSSMTNISNMKYQQQAFMYNSNLSNMLQGVIEFINDPYSISGMSVTLNYGHISPANHTVSQGTFASLTDFVAMYTQYGSLSFDFPTVTINVDATVDQGFYDADANCYFLPLFNVKTATTFIVNGGTVYLGVFDVVGSTDPATGIAVDKAGNKYVAVSRNQYGYAYANQTCVNAIGTKTGSEIIYVDDADPAKID